MVVYYYYYYYLEAQVNTQNYGKRPYGVGLLVVGHDVNIIIMLIFSKGFIILSRSINFIPELKVSKST